MPAPAAIEPRFSVLVPLEDARGEAARHLRSWTHEQTLPRGQFQMVVVSNGEDPADERAVADLLEPHDVLTRSRSDHVVGLWREAALRARAPWLIPTEAHCLADPACLAELAAALENQPDLDAAMFTHGHVERSRPAALTARWFEHCYAQWGRSEWPRLNLVGFAVRRPLFLEIDAFHPRYGLFAAHLLSARLHHRGALVSEVPGAVVSHIYHDTLREHHEHSADSARGECEVRQDVEEAFAERYFGHLELWSERMRYEREVGRATVRALLDHARAAAAGSAASGAVRIDLPWLVAEIAGWLPAAVAGPGPRAALRRLEFLASEFATERIPMPAAARWRGYLRCQDAVTELARLEWIGAQRRSSGGAGPGTRGVEELDSSELSGAHPPERREDGTFRWTHPVFNLRLDVPARGASLTIDTHGMRGEPLDYLLGVHCDGRPIDRRALGQEGGRLRVDLASRRARGAAVVTVVTRPFRPARTGSADMRTLGMPVFSISVSGAS